MGIYRKEKSWYLNFYYQGQRYQECIGPVSKTVAKEVEAKRRAEVIEGRYNLNQKKLTPFFEQFAQQYLEVYSRENKRHKSYIRDITAINHFNTYFTNKRLADITNWQIEKYKAMRKSKGVKEGTVNRELGIIRHMLNMAVKWGYLKISPFRGIKLFKENNSRMRILSFEEERILFDVIRANPMARHLDAIVTTALNTGMRRGEILSLKKDQIHFEDGYILVEGTKNGEIRQIPMNTQLTKTLKNVTKNSKPDDYLFSKSDGSPFGSIRTAFEKAVKKAALRGLRLHDLRHTFASRLVMGGVDLTTVGELMGHKELKMTKRYSHPTPEHKKAAVKILDQVTTILTTQDNILLSDSPKRLD